MERYDFPTLMRMARSLGADPHIGTELAGYRIEALLGRGGMSVVYLAEDLALGRKVALKLMAPELAEDRRFRERFRRESRLAASLDHPNVIPIYEAGEAEGFLYIAMRYVEGTDLKSLLAGEGPLEQGRALALLSQVAEALDAAHERELVHRDVKPSNVLLARQGAHEHAYLADFGLTKTAAAAEEGAESLQLSGTADYVAPEQITAGTAGAASDLYSLGCMLHECLTGQVPFARESELAVLWAHVDEPPPRPSNVRSELPHALDAILVRALAKDPGSRYETGHELVEAARAAFPEEPHRLGGRRLALAGGMLVLLLAAALVLALILMRGGQESGTEPTLDLATGALQRVDPETNELVATIRLGGEPVDVAAGADAIWVIDGARNSLVRVDPATSTVTTQGSGIGALAVVTAGPGSHVGIAADGPTGPVAARIDPRSLRTIEVGLLRDFPSRTDDPAPAVVSAVADVGATTSAGWLVEAAAGTVLRVGRTPPAPRVTVEPGGVPVALATAGRREVWVATRDKGGGPEGSAVRVDEQGVVRARVPLPFAPSAIASGKEGVWVADPDGRKVWRIEPDGARPRPVAVDGRPLHVAVGAGSVWVLTAGRGTLTRIDPRTLAVVATTEIGTNPSGVAVGEGGVWVAVAGGRPAQLPEFPRRYRGPGYPTESVHPATPRERCGEGLPSLDCLVVVAGRVRGEDGTPASVRFAWREQRRHGGSVVCQGKRRNDPVSSDVRGDAGTGRMEIEDWGTVAFNLDRMVYTYPRIVFPGGDLCGEQSGTWVGVRGAITGEAGTFTTRGPYNTLILAPPS